MTRLKPFSHKAVLQSTALHGLLARSGRKGSGRICSGLVQWSAYTHLLFLNCSIAPFRFSATVFISTGLADVLVWSLTPRWISNVLLLIKMFCLGVWVVRNSSSFLFGKEFSH